MREKTIQLYKNEGETPLECLERLRKERPEYQGAVLSYAGRLDPMAEGLLLVLVDEENKQREKYLNADKIYEVDVLLGAKTDTGDILGIVTELRFAAGNSVIPAKAGIQDKILSSFLGELNLPYPAYSSKPVEGIPLFQLAREGKIEETEIPTKSSIIHSIDLLDAYSLDSQKMLEDIIVRIGKVKGDFRQDQILAKWNEHLQDKSMAFDVLRIKVTCSSGTYMRSLAEAIAERMGTIGMAWKIKRTGILHKSLK